MDEIRTGNVATVIVKDQSRIGRDVVEAGLLKRTFDEYNVRFIAANDNLDTARGRTAVGTQSGLSEEAARQEKGHSTGEARKRSLEELAKLDRATAGDPEAQARYERFLATRRETTTGRNKRKPKPSKPANADTENARDNEVRGVFIVTAVPVNPYISAFQYQGFSAPP